MGGNALRKRFSVGTESSSSRHCWAGPCPVPRAAPPLAWTPSGHCIVPGLWLRHCKSVKEAEPERAWRRWKGISLYLSHVLLLWIHPGTERVLEGTVSTPSFRCKHTSQGSWDWSITPPVSDVHGHVRLCPVSRKFKILHKVRWATLSNTSTQTSCGPSCVLGAFPGVLAKTIMYLFSTKRFL